ncbi:MAG: squalene/phytoene synthase family protein, partial [Verrucomicrobiota bacterium]
MHEEEKQLLRSVSRSFYLSLIVLPEAMRWPTALAYLLARLSDTIADAGEATTKARLGWLAAFESAIKGEDWSPEKSWESWQTSLSHEGEKQLVGSADRWIEAYRALPEETRSHLFEVILTVIEGQRWDLTYFGDKEFRACPDAEQLDRYTFQVAGVVGQFWTKIAYSELGKKFADPDDASDLLIRGKKLGKALQLINILRDYGEDLRAG